jgi:putative PIN family toxin of toxin-antitoxin system
MSPEVLAEIRDVLNRPEHSARFPSLTPGAVDAFLAEYLRAAAWFSEVPDVFSLERDPKDSKYVNLAVAAEAPYLVTTDRDLLDLMDQSAVAGRDFQDRFPGLRVLDPIAFLDAIKKTAREESDRA